MEDVLSNPAMLMMLLAGLVVGIVVLAKVPELLVAVLMVGPTYIQLVMRIVGLEVSRRTFAAAGAALFIPIVILFFLMRMAQTRERTPLIGGPNVPFVICTIVMGLLLLVGYTYTPARLYGWQKTGEYFVFGMAPMILAFVFLRDQASAHRYLRWAIALTAVYIMLPLAFTLMRGGTLAGIIENGAETGEGVEGAIRANIAFGGAVVVLTSAVLGVSSSRTGGIWRVLPILLLPVMVYLILVSGSRSNIVAFGLVVPIGYFLAYRRQRAVLVGVVLLAGLVLLLLYVFGSESVQEKVFSSWVSEKTASGMSGASRFEMLGKCVDGWLTSPLIGQGTGAWPMFSFGLDAYDYPHNAFAELLLENGIVGFGLYCLIWGIVIRRIWQGLRNSQPGTEVYGMAVFGASIMTCELANSLSHFGLAHHSSTTLLSSAVVLRCLYLAEESREEAVPAVEGEEPPLRAVLTDK